MKKFLRFYNKDKENIKMDKQTEKGFDLIILDDDMAKQFSELSHVHENDDVHIIWQMKHKQNNYVLYKNCKFSDPTDNFFGKSTGLFNKNKSLGKKFRVTCNGTNFYSSSNNAKNIVNKSKTKYKDFTLLDRMLKIEELNLLNE